ncbi:MAG TPA: chromosome segregation protein SMC, partial [Syntrophobacteraceae bacterium]|nr:chromosome segregation protein SMC [Syntrophobacteraceae bacterium]
MNIKRLDLLGFKSFAGKTSIALTRGICAVVGPNGCGKSNVVDAIRWVLGETSAHELRGQKMHDVIFAGSKDRAPTNMAEVTILLDNEAGLAPEPYQQMPEILVTRRLFRSGESEYTINKTPVRRLDVQMLFMDTGLGQDGYAIIEQGKISKLVEARPEELREFLEEAAGVMRFKTRKKLALKKMDLTRQNLDRIQDLCIEVGRQTKRLAAEAQRARRHRTLRDQVRRLELTLALQEFEILQQRQVTVHQQLSEVRGELEISGREWREWQAQWRQFEQSWQEFQNDQQQCRERIGDIENKLALNRRDQDHLTSRRQQADQRLAEERQRQLSLEERRKEWLTEQTDLKTQLAQLAK